jgi:SAM-dependent methyltransferase
MHPEPAIRGRNGEQPQSSIPLPSELRCRLCGEVLTETFADLGSTPLCESYLSRGDLQKGEPFYPLCTYVCSRCFLVQVPEIVSPEEIFSHYAYFSSYSDSWLEHARQYTAKMIPRLGLDGSSLVVELASNDGYLLQYFMERGIPVLGVEPAANVAEAAERKGIPTLVAFFGEQTARELAASGKGADLLLGNNVLAHVPDLNGFIAGMKVLLKPQGVITMEFPHLMRLVEDCQFDTIYHEHFSYLSLTVVGTAFARHGLTVFDVEELPTHGGSLRIFARHAEDDSKAVGARVRDLLAREEAAGIRSSGYYAAFAAKVKETKRRLLDCLIEIKAAGKTIAAYGAAGKGNTLLNYCGIRSDFIDYVVDRSTFKQGKYLPGTRIPIFPPERIQETKPDFVLILPWNLQREITAQLAYIREWNGKFIVPIPSPQVL